MKVEHVLVLVVLAIVGANAMAQHLQPMDFSRPIPSLLQMGQITNEGTEESGETGSASETSESGSESGTESGTESSSENSGESSAESSSKLFPGASPGSSQSGPSSSSSSSGSSEESSEESTMRATFMGGSEASETSATATVNNVPQRGPGMGSNASPGSGASAQSSLDQFPPLNNGQPNSGQGSKSRFSESSESGEMSSSNSRSKKYVMPESASKRLPETDVFGEAPHTDLTGDEVDLIARHVLKGARVARCARSDEYCNLKFKNCATDKCREEASSQSSLSPGERAEIRSLLGNF